MLSPTLMDGLVLVLASSSLQAYSALAMSEDWLTAPVVQQPAVLTQLMLDLPVLQVKYAKSTTSLLPAHLQHIIIMQRFVMMDNYDWLVGAQSMKDAWRSAIMKHGELSVMMDLTTLMHQSSADKWDTPKWVRTSIMIVLD